MFKEFRDFILKGNMLDLAIGVIIGAAFGKVVTAFTELLLSAITFPTETTQVGAVHLLKKTGIVDNKEVILKAVDAGPLINSIFSLLIVGFALFLVVKAYNTAKRLTEKPAPKEEVAATVPADVQLLSEIRDLLKNKP